MEEEYLSAINSEENVTETEDLFDGGKNYKKVYANIF